MLSILYKEWGCPNCGCDSATSGCFSGGGVTTGHCKLTFEIRSDNGIGTVRYHPENPSDPKSEYVMEYARRIQGLVFQPGIGNQRMFVQMKESIGEGLVIWICKD